MSLLLPHQARYLLCLLALALGHSVFVRAFVYLGHLTDQNCLYRFQVLDTLDRTGLVTSSLKCTHYNMHGNKLVLSLWSDPYRCSRCSDQSQQATAPSCSPVHYELDQKSDQDYWPLSLSTPLHPCSYSLNSFSLRWAIYHSSHLVSQTDFWNHGS